MVHLADLVWLREELFAARRGPVVHRATKCTATIWQHDQWYGCSFVIAIIIALTIALSLAVARHAVRVDTWLCEQL